MTEIIKNVRCGPITGGVIRGERNWPIYAWVQRRPGGSRFVFSRVLPGEFDPDSMQEELQEGELLMAPGLVYAPERGNRGL